MDIISLGIPKSKANQFRTKGIETVEDLVQFLPRHYYDFRNPKSVRNVSDGEIVSVVVKVLEIKEGDKYVRLKTVDDSNKFLYITFFNQPFLARYFQVDTLYNFCGKIEINAEYYSVNMLNPFYYSDDLDKYKRIIPIYSKIQGMGDDYLLRSINTALALVDKEEHHTPEILDKYELLSKKHTIKGIHQPDNFDEIELAKKRLLFDDLFLFATQIALKFKSVSRETDVIFPRADTIKSFLQSLPFSLTEDQLGTVREIYKDMRSGNQVNALVQGDVGSGKTMVAFMLMLIAAENGYQSTLMAPTNVLAQQHFLELEKIGERMGYKVGFVTGGMKAKEKKEVLKGLKDGSILMAVGTHALITEGVEFNNLGLTIVDEEHRFGVMQRNQIASKTNRAIHRVTMSATPIPRSLAITVHGENVSVYNIMQMPAGRKPIETVWHKSAGAAYELMREEIKKGRQCYAVCPLIEESNAQVMEGVLSVTELYYALIKHFAHDDIKVDLIAGSMKKEVIEEKIADFAAGKIDVLISTTIIEVGVNVPNSTVMLIQNAERFGLAQLHQLRGRVGRGSHQSYCILVSDDEGNEKLEAMVETSNGFKIAETDLRLRGPGDFLGTRQSGDNKFIMLMLAYPKLFQDIRADVKEILSNEALKNRYVNYLNMVSQTL